MRYINPATGEAYEREGGPLPHPLPASGGGLDELLGPNTKPRPGIADRLKALNKRARERGLPPLAKED